jgi:hypothetical protein
MLAERAGNKYAHMECSKSKDGLDLAFPRSNESKMCTMDTCFDVSRCAETKPGSLSVYLYDKPSKAEFGQYHDAMRKVSFIKVVTDPAKACLFVPVVNTNCI